MTSPAASVTQEETIAAILDGSKRSEVPIRKTFLQQGSGRVRDPGPLARLCTSHDERALELYLLVHARASADPFDVVLPAGVWARAIGLSGSASARSGVSKAFRRLEGLRLLTRERSGRRAKVTLLDEGGAGTAYVDHPSRRGDRYLKLPYAYWARGWHLRLSMPAKVVLLILLSLDDGALLPAEKGPDWYGISADTVQRGVAELREQALVEAVAIRKKAPLAPDGFTTEYRYTLAAPFGPLRKPLATVTRLHA